MNEHENKDRTPVPSRFSRLCSALQALDQRVSGASGRLSPGQRSALLIGVSLAFAGAMVAGPWILGLEDSQTVIYVLIALWWIPFSILSTPGDEDCKKSAR